MAQQRNEIVLARFSQGQRIPCRLRFCRAGFRVSFRPGHRERCAGEVREAGQDSAVLGVEKVLPVVRHHPQGAPRLRFTRNRHNQFFDNLGDNRLQTGEVPLGKREQLPRSQFERNAARAIFNRSCGVNGDNAFTGNGDPAKDRGAAGVAFQQADACAARLAQTQCHV